MSEIDVAASDLSAELVRLMEQLMSVVAVDGVFIRPTAIMGCCLEMLKKRHAENAPTEENEIAWCSECREMVRYRMGAWESYPGSAPGSTRR